MIFRLEQEEPWPLEGEFPDHRDPDIDEAFGHTNLELEKTGVQIKLGSCKLRDVLQ